LDGFIEKIGAKEDQKKEIIMLCKVYKHTLNGKIYIGQTWRSMEERVKNGYGYEGCTHFYRAIEKYSWQNVETEILALCAEQKEADFLEQFYISEYKSWNRDFGYNLKLGGSHGRHSVESKKKMSNSHKGKVISEETKKNMSNGQKGRVFSEEHKVKMSNSHKGKVISEETRKKLSNSKKGRVFSEEHKKNISNSKKGKPNNNKGKTRSEETKKKMSNNKQGRKPNNSSSIYIGVYFLKNSNKWVAHIKKDGKNKHLGCFTNEILAAVKYDLAAKELYGENAKLNFIPAPSY
jgi:group I intron endonuclease